MKSISSLFILIIFMLLLSGCGGTNNSTSTSTIETEGEYINTSNNIEKCALHQGIIKDSITQTPLQNVKVIVQDQITYSDENGFYSFSNLLPKDKETITYKKNNYTIGSKVIAIKNYSDTSNHSINFIELNMYPYDQQYLHNTAQQVFNSNNFYIEIPEDIYLTKNNIKYNKEVQTNILYKKITTKKNKYSFPGLYQGQTTEGTLLPLISFAYITIDIEDKDKNKLNISENLTITFKNIQETNLNIIPLWYYDYERGIWIEEGYVTRLENGNYEGSISHTGTWSISKTLKNEPAIYSGYIVDEEGLPMTNIRLNAIGDHWIKYDLTTDEQGKFEIEVIPNENFKLYAYDYQNKFSAEFNGIIEALAPGEIIEE